MCCSDLPLASGPSCQALLRIVESTNDRTICDYPLQDLLDYFAQEPRCLPRSLLWLGLMMNAMAFAKVDVESLT